MNLGTRFIRSGDKWMVVFEIVHDQKPDGYEGDADPVACYVIEADSYHHVLEEARKIAETFRHQGEFPMPSIRYLRGKTP